jgi:membrane fusion protein
MNDGGGESGQGTAVGVPLFRPEVLRHQQPEWLGPILIKPRAMNWWFAAIAGVTVLAILLLLFAASYTRKAHVAGWLLPQQGMVRVFAPRAAVVSDNTPRWSVRNLAAWSSALSAATRTCCSDM